MKSVSVKMFFGPSVLVLGLACSLSASANRSSSSLLTESMVEGATLASRAAYHPPEKSCEVGTTSYEDYEVLSLDRTRPIVTACDPQAAEDYVALQKQGYKGFIPFEGVYGRGTKQYAGFVAFRKKANGSADVLVAYHGTQSLADLYTDLACGEQPLPFAPGGAHGGFLSAYTSGSASVKQIIAQIIAENALTPEAVQVRIAGHSLGGALATLAGYELTQNGYETRVLTFGSPRVFNLLAAADYENRLGSKTARVWGEDDLISAVVLGRMLGKKHVGIEVCVPASGETLAAHKMGGYAQKVNPAAVVEHVRNVAFHKEHQAKFERDLKDLQLDKATAAKMREAYEAMYPEVVEKKKAQSVAHGLKNAVVSLGGMVKSAVTSVGSTLAKGVRSLTRWFSRS